MTTFIALLRAINVGGNNKIKMADIKASYEALGFDNVQTLLQSGNIAFQAESDESTLIQQMETAIQEHFNLQIKVLIRTAQAWQAILANHPFSDEQLAEPSKILITFLDSEPTTSQLTSLYESHTGTEIIKNIKSELYIYYPDGMGRSKLDNKYIERKLKRIATGRNWNTVNKLLAMTKNME